MERFFVCEMCLMEEHSGVFELVFYSEKDEKPKMIMRFGILPRVMTKVCFDFNWLDGHVLFPGNTPGALKFVCHGSRIEKDEIYYVALRSYKSFHDITVEIKNLELTDEKPTDYPLPKIKIVDRFGQSCNKEWKSKIKSEDELKVTLTTLLSEPILHNEARSDFYGDKTRKLMEGTGYFTKVKKDNRWYLVDPLGYAFFSMGPDCVRPQKDGRIDGVEQFLEWLPDRDSREYQLFVMEKETAYNDHVGRAITKSISYENINLYRVWKEDWYDNWKKLVFTQLINHGMNSLGNWSDENLFGTLKIPYVTQLKEFPSTKNCIFRDFPDVLSEEFAIDAQRCAKDLQNYEADPYMIGYFLRNEPAFAFVDNLIIADEVLYNPQASVCKDKLIDYLRDKYNEIDALNQAYGLDLLSFDALNDPIKNISNRSDIAKEDMRHFSRVMMRAYVEIPSKACKAIDKNHMNLGMRWAWISDIDLVVGWENFDVFSINCYAVDPTDSLDNVSKLGVDLPVMIGEFHFGALDAGPTATGLEGVLTQKDRGIAYKHYCEKVAVHPLGVGCHYFQFYDQFILGRFDGENYNIGLFDVCSQPYKDMMEYVKSCSDEIYDIMDKKKEPTMEVPVTIPMIAY